MRRTSAVLLAIAYTGPLAASFTIASRADLTTRTGRHLMAGALGIAALVLAEVLICAIPLRRGDPWAWWAALVPLLVLAGPIFIIDAMFVPARTRGATLLPQGIGLFVSLVLLALAFPRPDRGSR